MKRRGRPYRPRAVAPMPLCWGMSDEARRSLRVRDLQALALMLENQADEQHLCDLEASCVAGIWICAEVIKSGLPQFDPMAVHELRQQLEEGARALLTIRERAERIGRFGCSGPERLALQSLCDQVESLRDQVPRRILLAGYQAALENRETPMPRTARGTT